MEKTATTAQPVHELLAKRWSPRSFDPDWRISAEQTLALAEAARWAPSCFGAEPWAFVFCAKQADPQAWELAMDCLAEGNRTWAANTGLLVLAVSQENFAHNDSPNGWCKYDTGAASMSLVLQAEALGLRAHQMGGFDPAKALEVFEVPAGWSAAAMIAVGRQAAADAIDNDDMKAREVADRSRQELGSKFFAGKWGSGLA